MPEPIDVVEALLFASDTPVEAERIQEVLDLESAAAAREIVEGLRARLDAEGRALQVMEVGGGFRLVTRPEVAPWLVKLARSRTRSRLSRPALETLAIIGYRQPVSRPEVDAVRGVNSDAVLGNLPKVEGELIVPELAQAAAAQLGEPGPEEEITAAPDSPQQDPGPGGDRVSTSG